MARGLGKNRRGFANSAVTKSVTTPIAAVELSDPVSLYLPFDSDVNDDSDNNHTVTAGGGATISSTQSKFGGNSLNLDGTNDYLSVAASTDFDFGTGLFTVEGWIYSEKPQSENLYSQGIVYTGASGAWSVSLGHLAPNNIRDHHTIQFTRYVSGSDTYNFQTAQNLTRNAWHHFAVVRESPTTIKIYVDGVLSATEDSVAASAEFNSTGGAIEIGRNYGTTNTAHFVNGYIDDLRISKGVARYTKDFIPPTQAVGAKLTGSNETNTTTDLTAFYAPYDSDLNDDSSNAGTGTASGSAAISNTQAKFGSYSLYMPTENHAVTYPNTTDFDFGTGPFTVEFWAYATATAYGNFESVMGFGSSSEWSVTYLPGDASNDGGYFEFAGGNGGYTGIDGVGQGAAAQWMHIAFTRDDSGTIRYFVNGTIKNSNANDTTSRVSNGNTFKIGYTGSANRSFQGYLDDIRILKGYAKYTAEFAPPTSAVGTSVSETVNDLAVLYLPFDSDTQFQDQARNHGIHTIGSDPVISTSVKKFGTGSLHLDGNDYLWYDHDESLNFGTNDFTVEAWFYVADDSSVGRWLGKSDVSSGNQYGWFIVSQTNNKWGFNAGSGTSEQSWDIANNADLGTLTLNTWTHLAVTREGNTFRLFNNGSLITTITSSLSMTTGDQPLGIGRQGGNSSTGNGYIDDVRVINGKALYTAAFTPPTSAVGSAVIGGGVTSNIVDNKFLSSVWSLKDQNKKISKGEWIRNDAADTGVNAKGRSIKGSGLEVYGHRHFQGGNVKINAIGAGGHIGGGTPAPAGWPGSVAHNEMFGGFTSMEINITPGTPLNVIVGGGGEKGPTSNPFGGGGAVRSPTGEAGSGGGYSGVFEGPVSQGNAIAIAGGGGGGRPSNAPSGWTFLFNGDTGAGGGLEGNSGGSSAPAEPDHVPGRSMHGTGGTQSAGGVAAGFLDGSPVPSSNQGDAGSALQGGNGAPAGGTGGGGGGYYGGGGGWKDPGFSGGGGGGGGSSYITPAAVGSPYTVTGGANGTLPTGLAGNSYGLVNDLPPSYSLKHGAVEIIDGAGPTVYTYTGSTQTHTVT